MRVTLDSCVTDRLTAFGIPIGIGKIAFPVTNSIVLKAILSSLRFKCSLQYFKSYIIHIT